MPVSPTAVADASRYFASWLAFRQRFERVPGVQAAVLHDDALELSVAYGHADLERQEPLTADHLFRIASHSKTFTATAIMQLAERRALRLDDEAQAWLPHLKDSPAASVTIRELLAHGSGMIRDGWDGDFWQLSRSFPDADDVRRVSIDDADVLARNERFKYSNIGFSLLGLVIEAASGQSYNTYVTDNVVAPLGLQNTGPELDPERATQYSTGYSALTYSDRRIPIDHIDTGAMSAATGFYSTASDVVRYVAAHFLGDERLLTDNSKRQMQRTEWKVEGTESSYALGFAVARLGGRRVLGHGGGFPGHITRTFFDPIDRIAVSVLTNAIDGPALAMATAGIRLIDLAQAGVDGSSKVTERDAIDLSRFRGRFASLWGVYDVVDLGGRLYQLDPSVPDPTLEPQVLDVVDERTLTFAKGSGYGSQGERMQYEFADDGSVLSVRGGSGSLAYPIEDFALAAAGRDRITVGSPLRPSPR
jgi:CubicO group peptidase (beta-lactamase class C family)